MCLVGVAAITGIVFYDGPQSAKATSQIPSNAVLVTTDGSTEVFVDSSVGRSGDVKRCVGYVDLGEIAEACSPYAKAESEGVAVMNIVDGSATTVVVLVPNSASSVMFTNSNGVKENVTVTKRVAILQGIPIASFSYVLPNGGVHTTKIHWHRPTGHSVMAHHRNR